MMAHQKMLLSKLEAFATQSGNTVIPTSIKIEQEIALLEDEERKEYLELMDMDEPVLIKLFLKDMRSWDFKHISQLVLKK